MNIHEKGPGGKGGRSTQALSIQRLLNLNGLTAIDLGRQEGYNCFDPIECGCHEVRGSELRDRYLAAAEKREERSGYSNAPIKK
jgi:hypothetical protein